MFYGVYVKGELKAHFQGDELGLLELHNYISLNEHRIAQMLIVPFTRNEVVPTHLSVMGIHP